MVGFCPRERICLMYPLQVGSPMRRGSRVRLARIVCCLSGLAVHRPLSSCSRYLSLSIHVVEQKLVEHSPNSYLLDKGFKSMADSLPLYALVIGHMMHIPD